MLIASALQGCPGIGTPLLANVSANGAITVLVGASAPIAASTFRVNQVYRARIFFTWVRVGTVAYDLVFALVVGGVQLTSRILTTPTVAGTYHGTAEATFTVRSVGTSGQLIAAVAVSIGQGTQTADVGAIANSTGPAVVNTALATSIEFRCNMSSAQASNTLTVSQGYVERVFG